MRSASRGTILACLAGSLVTATMFLSLKALAEGDPVPRQVVYEGRLDKDGRGFNGALDMTFEVFDGAAAQTATWEERQNVSVFVGRFAALLGSTSATKSDGLVAALKASDDLYLAVTLHTTGGDVALSGRKRFVPAPYAMWAAHGSDLTVGQALSIDSSLTVTSSAADAPLKIDDGADNVLVVDGDELDSDATSLALNGFSEQEVYISGSDGLFVNTSLSFASTNGDGGVAMQRGDGDMLVINPGGQLGGKTTIHGSLSVTDGDWTGLKVSAGANLDACADKTGKNEVIKCDAGCLVWGYKATNGTVKLECGKPKYIVE